MKRSPALRIARRGLLAIVCVLPAVTVAVDVPSWPTLGGDMQRTGLSPYQGPSIGCVKWRFQTAEEPEFPSLIYPPCRSARLGGHRRRRAHPLRL